MAQIDYSVIWRHMAYRWASAVSNVSGPNWGYAVNKKESSRLTTYSKHNLPVAKNLLNQQFQIAEPNKVWLSDITYIPTDEGWLYLAGHKDLFTKR